MKGKSEKSGGRILLGDNTGDVPVTLRPIRFQYVGFWISTGLPCIYTYIFNSDLLKIRLATDIP